MANTPLCNAKTSVQQLGHPTTPTTREGVVRGRWAPHPAEGKAQEREREVERECYGKEQEEGQRVVRGRWAPPPMEAKCPREGQRMAIGQ